jgi:hypothetical protein
VMAFLVLVLVVPRARVKVALVAIFTLWSS